MTNDISNKELLVPYADAYNAYRIGLKDNKNGIVSYKGVTIKWDKLLEMKKRVQNFYNKEKRLPKNIDFLI